MGSSEGGAFNDMWTLDVKMPGGPKAEWNKVEAKGDLPEGRWLHSATEAEGKIYIFGGMLNDKVRHNDIHVFDPKELAWRKLNPRSPPPAPRAHHTTTYVGDDVKKLLVFGGYGGGGRSWNEMEAFDITTLTWAPISCKGTLPTARFDHTATLAGDQLYIIGGRNNDGPIEQMAILDISTFTWSIPKLESTESPVPIFAHMAVAIKSALAHKVFTFGGRTKPFEYDRTVYCMDTRQPGTWLQPENLTDKAPISDGRENAACVFDSKGARLLFIGGWNNRYRMDVGVLQVSGIVGPSYAVTTLESADGPSGPLSGGRELTVKGLNFVGMGKVEVRFTNRSDAETVSGEVIDENTLTCVTPSFEEFGPQEVEVKVSMNGEMFTVNPIFYRYYDDTKGEKCVSYGPGLISASAGRPASFLVQAKNCRGESRTSGTDQFTVEVVYPDGKRFMGSCVDHGTGSYTMTYVAPNPGDFELHVKLGRAHIRGSPKQVSARDLWRDISPINGPANSTQDEVCSCPGLPGFFMTWKDSKHAENAVNVFNSDREAWEPALLDGKVPMRSDGASHTFLGTDKVVQIGGYDVKKKETTSDVHALVLASDGSKTWNWAIPAVTGTAPDPRQGHAALNFQNEMVCVSGGEGAGHRLDFHALAFASGTSNVAEWVPLACKTEMEEIPNGRFDHSMCAPDKGNKVYIFGGKLIENKSYTRDEWIAEFGDAELFDFYDQDGSGTVDADEYLNGNKEMLTQFRAERAAKAEEEAAAAAAKAEQDLADGIEDYGEASEDEEGEDGEGEKEAVAHVPEVTCLNDVCVATIDKAGGSYKWEVLEAKGEIPCPRSNSICVWLDGFMLMQGGNNSKGEILDDLYTYTPGDQTWRKIYEKEIVQEDKFHQMVLDSKAMRLVSLSTEDGGQLWDVGSVLDLKPLLEKTSFSQDMNEVVLAQLQEVEQFISTTDKAMDTEVGEGQLDQLLRVMGALSDVSHNGSTYDLRIDELMEAARYLESQGISTANIDKSIETLTATWDKMKQKGPKRRVAIRGFQEKEGRRIKANINDFGEKMEAQREEFRTISFFFWGNEPKTEYNAIRTWDKTIKDSEEALKKMTKLAELFEATEAVVKPKEFIGKCREELRLVKVLWDSVALVNSYYSAWNDLKWVEIETEGMEDINKALRQELRVMDKRIRQEIKAYEGLRDLVTDMGVIIPVIGDLRSDSMRIRHWDQIKTICKVEDLDTSKINDLSFKNLMSMHLADYVDNVTDIVDASQKEAKIEKNLVVLSETWSTLEWEFYQHNTTDIWLVRVNEDTFDTLEDNQVLVQNMSASRFVGEFEKEVGQWQTHLATVAEVITIIGEIQRTWAYLEELFIGSEEVKRELPEDAERFVGIDRDVKEVLVYFNETPNLVECCNADKLFTKLENTQHLLEMCEKSLMDFMEAKRRAFPRFYFVSTKDLLDILSNGNRPEKVMEHIPKIFQAIASLDLKDEKDASGEEIKTAMGMYSPEKEYVPFAAPTPLVGKVEMWLHRTIDGMRAALRNTIKKSEVDYKTMKRPQFIMDYQGQICITTCQTFWCVEVEQCFVDLKDGKVDALKKYLDFQQEQIVELIAKVRTPMEKNERRKIMNIITLDSHARVMVLNLVRDNVTLRDAFGWQCQLKYSIAEDGFTYIDICDAHFKYAYEYLGNGPRLVITPLTDRIYITATQALHLVMGCAPAGPAGTGKTETTKDLASQLGCACYVFNCSDQMDFRSMGDIFKGLASSGTWGCFDEFNRVSPEVLSVCSVQYKSVLDGVKKRTGYFNFPGEEELVLNYEVGAFITMNPGYLGRTELPEGLKALFRPVTVVVPDFELICENMLMAEGYEDATDLAHKFVILYQLCRDLLSKQLHYDWGLRAIKSVLVVAGGFKRAEPEVPELALLMRALRDFNIPKIPALDMVVFMGLIADLFPNMNIPPKRNMELEGFANEILTEEGKIPAEDFILKVSQLEELIAIRHCVFLLGKSGDGKSEVYKTLSKVWTKQGNKTTVRDINPKAIHVDEFYGVISLATREWKDGLMSCTMRDLSRIPDTLPKWIVLDGDLDANWIESMNSVMDDNRLLTLASNERIPLLPHMRLIFELRDLHFASPATVSRAGILYISTGEQYKWYIESWIQAKEGFNTEQKEILRVLFEKYTDPCLDYLLKHVKFLSPTLNFNIVQSLCHLLDGVLTKENIPEDCEDKMLFELFFCFAAVWAFGGGLSVKDGEDHRHRFNKWWRQQWRPIKFPDQGTVFDYFADVDSTRYLPWSDVVEVIDYSPETPVTSVTVPTQETTGLSFWITTMMAHRTPLLLVGYSGCGKTAVIKGTLQKLDAEEIIYTTINFNYFTDARMLQKMLEQPLEKKAGKNYGPPGQKRLIYFLDDLNMPKLDPYNTQTPIALCRQHMDYGHWYDIEKLQAKNIGNVQYMACMNPAAGSFNINPRLQRHFVTFAVGFPNSDSLTSIYSTFLSAALKNFDPAVSERCAKLIGAGLELHQRCCNTFRKTAIKFHYEFNIRHTTNMFRGVMVAKKEDIRQPEKLVKLWLHEAERTYCDLLMTPEDGELYGGLARQVAKKYFPSDKDTDIFPNLNVYCYFAKGLADKAYADIPNIDKLDELLDEALRDYNENFAVMNLVLFEDAMRHICRISRIIETGHALLVGVGGSGKQSLSRLTSFIAGATVSMITISRGYSANDLKNDIMAMYVKAGMKDEVITFMMTDSQITDERFLVYINDLLASGDIPDLFPPEDKENVVNGVRNEVKAAGIIDTNDNCYEFFLDRVRANLHMILCFSPVGDNLRVRARRFPALVNNTVIDWFHPWPADALQSVSERFLGEVDLGTDEEKDAIIKFMPFSFVTVNNASAEFLRKLKRFNYTTPKSFLELIDLYKTMLDSKRETLLAQTDRLQQGLDKLQGTAKAVGELEEILSAKAIEVEEQIAVAEALSEKVGREKAFCETESAAAAVEADKCAEIKIHVTQVQADCERDLAAALPAVGKAMAALDTITKKDLVELKALKKPPAGIDDVLSAVICLLADKDKGVPKDKSWQAAGKLMKDVNKFMDELFGFKEEIDKEVVPASNFKAVRPYLKDEGFDPQKILRKSNAAAGLCGWVVNIVIYYDIVSDVEPKKRLLAQSIEDLASATVKLSEVTEKVATLNAQLKELEDGFAKVMKEKEETIAESERMAKKLEMAQRLIAALASENVRWSKGVGELQKQFVLLPGDVLVSAAFVSYVGAFNNVFRKELMDDHFMPYITEYNIPRSEVADPVKLLTDDARIATWSNDGLPTDPLSIENGCLVTTCVRWPLLIDPQMQGIVWIKTSQEKNNLLVTRLGVKGMLDRMERCIENGDAVLIENLQETVDAVLGPIIGRQFFKKNRNLYVKLGEKEVEVHKDFRLFLHTKLSNPHFPPEIQAETTLVNFTVTEDGLEDQLLARVVKKERPDLEQQKADLMRQQNEFKIKLKEIEDSLLFQLATAEGDLTENIELIENLEESKRVSVEISEKAEIAQTTEKEINETREGYRIVATRAALLFFMLTSLVRVHSLYMYSLASFVTVFERAIDLTAPDEELEGRLKKLIENITYTVWHFTRRGLFEKHKLTICTQLLLLTLKKAGKVDPEELEYLMTGKSALEYPTVPDEMKKFMNEGMWGRIHHLKNVPGFGDVVDDIKNNPKSLKAWRAWVEEDKAEKGPFPPKMEPMSTFQKMCIVRAMRPDRINDALTDWCMGNLGSRYVEEPSFSMSQVLTETTPANPVFFVLFPGVNPYNDVEMCGKEMGYTEAAGNLRRISMGQGQEEVANSVIDAFSEKGGWVFMDNIHLMSKWLPVLERKLEICAEEAHADFRAFLSAEPHPDPMAKTIPQSILESSIKIINMPPMSLKANMHRAYSQFSQSKFDSCEKKDESKAMVFALCFFHSCLVGRHKFGAQGWSRKYGFNFGDLTISGDVIQNYLNNNDFVPWNDVIYIIGEVMYGGHITDKWDRRVCASYLEEFMKPEILAGHDAETLEDKERLVMNLAPGFKCPDPSAGEYDFMGTHIEEKFPVEGPTLFGLHNNAEIGYLLASADALFAVILDVSGGGVGEGDGDGEADSGMEMIEELQGLLPEMFDEITLGQRATDRTPYVCVIIQEVERMNLLTGEIRRSLTELKLGLEGALNMSDLMDDLLVSLKLGRVPSGWNKQAYPSLKALGLWFTDMLVRIEQLQAWEKSLDTPFVVWISALFNPMAYVTAILQTTARAKNLPLDQMEVWTDVLNVVDPGTLTAYPADGMYIHGCCMEGARWDMKRGQIAESLPKDLHPAMPVINVRGVTYADVDKTGIFECPVYITTQRGGTFTFIATLKTNERLNKWVLGGVALMMSDDIAGD